MNAAGRIRAELRLAAKLAADVAGYSPMIGSEEGTLSGWSDPIACNLDSICLDYLRNPEHRKLLELTCSRQPARLDARDLAAPR